MTDIQLKKALFRLPNGTYITPSEGFDGMSSITIDLSEITRLLSEI